MTGHGGFVYAQPIPTRERDESDDAFIGRIIAYFNYRMANVVCLHEATGIIACSFYVENLNACYDHDIVPYVDCKFDYLDVQLHVELNHCCGRIIVRRMPQC